MRRYTVELYAKSSPPESIVQHTEELLERLVEYKAIFQSQLFLLTEEDWQLLRLAILYHDIGKADGVFQNKIRSMLSLPGIKVESPHDIPHNILSVLAIPYKLLELNGERAKLLAQLVAYHHERGDLPEKELVKENYEKNIIPIISEIETSFADHQLHLEPRIKTSALNKIKLNSRFTPQNGEIYWKYVLLKGILHRLDHAASAHVPIELATEMNVQVYVNRFMKGKFNKNKLQQFTEQHQSNHLIITAQTGMGKTESALLWIGNKKGFFTLPLRVSINAMYERIKNPNSIGFSKFTKKYGEEAVGLLHANSLDFLYGHEEGNDKLLEKIHGQSKELANKLIITTIDQILKFPFYYLGFEKELATMASAKIVIDELQAYDPKIAAVLIRAMSLIDQIGGSFMIMTATLPPFYVNALRRELKDREHLLIEKEFINDDVKRHHVQTIPESILDEEITEEIMDTGKSKSVLIICNQVDRAQEVFQNLIETGAENCWLLHSRFIKQDRANLEKQIMQFSEQQCSGIWVTTQLVEASLDIDFDMLYTEMSTLDSQFQRYGRCNRKNKKPINEVNVKVLTEEVSGVGTVYHQEIYDESLRLLSEHESGLLLESSKQKMIRHLYDEGRLSGSSFKASFDEALLEIKNRPHYQKDMKKGKAQELLRNIQQEQVIPLMFSEETNFQQAILQWKQAIKPSEKRKYRREIEKYSLSVNKYKTEHIVTNLKIIKGLHYIDCHYDEKLGLIFDKQNLFF